MNKMRTASERIIQFIQSYMINNLTHEKST
jgi:hypothetical protein